ncbi:MAG TPA: MFS transporter [Caulobacteraceae bacterium]
MAPDAMAGGAAMPSPSAAELRRTSLGLRLTALYGFGSIADSVTQAALGTFLFFYLTAVCGLSNSLAGLSLFVALAVDSLIDPLVGSISDNSWTRLGRRHPFMFAGAIPLAIGLGLLFSVPANFAGPALFAYVTAVSIFMRIGHSIYFLPYVGLGAELSDDYAERTNIVASRFLFGVIGTAAGLSLGLLVFMGGPQGLMRRAAYAPFGWSCGAVALTAALVAAFGTLRTLPRLHRVAPPTGSFAVRFARDMVEIFSNRSFVALFVSLLFFFVGAGAAVTIGLHTSKFFWKLPNTVIQAVALSAPVGTLIGVPISVFISNRIEKRMVALGSFVVLIAYHASITEMRILGVLPPNGPALYAILIGLGFVLGAVVGCAGISFQSMMADAADEHEFHFGTRREGLYYAGLNFSAKAATGLGALFAGVALDLIHFPTDLANRLGASLRINQEVVNNLGLIYGPGVALIYVGAVVAFLFYRLDRSAYADIQRGLEARRRSPPGEAPPLSAR